MPANPKLPKEKLARWVKLGLTDAQIAERAGVSRQAVGQARGRLKRETSKAVATDQAAARDVLFSLRTLGEQLNQVVVLTDDILMEVRGQAMEDRLIEAAGLALRDGLSDSQAARLKALAQEIRDGYSTALRAADTKLKLVKVAADSVAQMLIIEEIQATLDAIVEIANANGISKRAIAQAVAERTGYSAATLQ